MLHGHFEYFASNRCMQILHWCSKVDIFADRHEVTCSQFVFFQCLTLAFIYMHALLFITVFYLTNISVDHIVIGAAHCYCRYKEIPMHEVNIRTHPYIVGALSSWLYQSVFFTLIVSCNITNLVSSSITVVFIDRQTRVLIMSCIVCCLTIAHVPGSRWNRSYIQYIWPNILEGAQNSLKAAQWLVQKKRDRVISWCL